MAAQTNIVALSIMDDIREFTQDITSSSDGKVFKTTENPVDSLSLVDHVLDGLDNLLGIVSVSEKGSVNSSKCLVKNGEISLPARKPRTYSMNTQTSDHLMSDSISAMETQLLDSRCKLEVMTEYYKNVEVDFRNTIGRHTSAADKAKADLETSQKQTAELKTKLAQLEKECSPHGDDAHPQEEETEAEPEYKPENTQGYRPRPRKNFEIREHYFVGETPPPAWARVKPVQSEQLHMVHPHRGNIPPPPPVCFHQGYRSPMPPPPLHRPCSAPGWGRIPPPPPFAPSRCHSELANGMAAPPPPPPGFCVAPPRGFMPPPPPPPEDSEVVSPPPGDFIVRPMTPCGLEEGQRVRFGVREILYI